MKQLKRKRKKTGFLVMLLGTLTASLLGNMFAGKGVNCAGEELSNKMKEQLEPVRLFLSHFVLWLILKYKDIKMNLNFMMFIQELIEKTMGQM